MSKSLNGTATLQTIADTAALNAAYFPATVVTGLGIDPTGTSVSTTAIQSKITAAGQSGTVYFPKGTYLADGLTPLSGQTWTGPGTIKRPNASTVSMIAAADLTGFTMQGLTIDGNRAGASATSNSAVFLTRSTGGLFTGCTFQNMPTNNPAFEIRGGTHNRITSNQFITVGYGINVGLAYGSTDACYSNTISGNIIDGSDLNGIFITENIGSQAGTVTGLVKDISIINNVLRNCGDVGIEAGSGSVDVSVTGNDIISTTGGGTTSTGILIRDAKRVTVTGNTVSGYTGASSVGIVNVNLNGLRTTDLSLIGNVVNGSGNSIKIQDVDGLTISGGSLTASLSDSLVLVNPTRFAVNGVTVHQAGAGGISLGTYNTTSAVDGSVTNCVVTDSAFITASRDGIAAFFNSANFTLANNRCLDTRSTGKTQRYGINITTTTVTNYNIISNILSGNLTGGLSDSGPASPKNVAYNL